MKKLAEEVVRFNARLPKVVADWVGAKAKAAGVTLSEEVRIILMDAKAGEDFLIENVNRFAAAEAKRK